MNSPSPIHLLQLVPEPLPTYRADVAVLFGKYLPRSGVHCHIVGMPSNNEVDTQNFASIRTAHPGGGRWRKELSYLSLCLSTLFGASKKNYDLIQVRDMVSIGLLGLVVARMKGIPFVYWISYLMTEDRLERARSGIKTGDKIRSRLVLLKGLIEHEILYKIVLPGARHVFVQSDAMQQFIAAKGISPEKLTAVPMGVDTETLLPENINQKRLPGWDGVPLIAYLGTLCRFRRLQEVVDAFAIVKLTHPQARLLFIGDSHLPKDSGDLLSYIREKGLNDEVHITGWLPSSQAWALLAGTDVAVSFFPRSEILDTNSPTKLLEYLALGLPCVGNDNPDQAQLLSNSGVGWLTESNPAALAKAMSEVLTDTEAARKRAASGPKYIYENRSYRVLAPHVAERYRFITNL